MRPLPSKADFGAWDTLPANPPVSDLDMTNPDVTDALERRERLIKQWHQFFSYPHGVWSEQSIKRHPEMAEGWRNWFLRRAWEGITITNACLVRWSKAD